MTDFEHQIKRILKLCPNIVLTAKDLQTVLDENTWNTIVVNYKAKNSKIEPKEEKIETIEIPDEGFDDEKELAEHIVECDDKTCECKSVFDEPEQEEE